MDTPTAFSSKRYEALIATGGIGSGIFASLAGNHTLGREESRSVRFLARQDYCKGHIIAHYASVLAGSGFHTILIGRVGDDLAGRQLIDEMHQAGIDTSYVEVTPRQETLYSVCFLYPDGSGGNLTSEDSASSHVSQADIALAEREFAAYAGCGIAVAAPEVPLKAREALMQLATRYHFFRAGSFVSAEVNHALNLGLFGMLDLLALNTDEAAVLVGLDAEATPAHEIASAAAALLSSDFPHMALSMTAGQHGSWLWDGAQLLHKDPCSTRVIGTTGAGDAHLGGMIAGLAAGLSLADAQELGSLTAALSVTSPHTIAPDVDRAALLAHAEEYCIALSPSVLTFLRG